MATHRTHHNKENPYVVINKGFLENPSLSAKAKGILAYLLSRPDGWETHTEQLIAVMKDGRDSILSGLKELEEEGYFVRFAVTDPVTNRITHWVKDVFESPELAREEYPDRYPGDDSDSEQAINGKAVRGKAINGKAVRGKAINGKAVRGKAINGKADYIVYKEQSINEELNIDLLKNEIVSANAQEKLLSHLSAEVELVEEPESAFALLPSCEVEILATSTNQETDIPVDSQSLISINNVPPSSLNSNNQNTKIADRVRSQWQATGHIPTIPLEFEAWAAADLGFDVIVKYRHSGRLTTTTRGDINKDFALYVASQNKGKDVDYGFNRIKNLEKDPQQWEILAAIVAKWEASKITGDRSFNIMNEIAKKEVNPLDAFRQKHGL